MVHSVEHLVLFLIMVVGLIHAGTFAADAVVEFLEKVRKVVEKVREMWEELKKFF